MTRLAPAHLQPRSPGRCFVPSSIDRSPLDFIDTPLIIPDNTVVKGEGMDLVSIYFAEATCPCDLVEMARLYAENASLCKIVILSRFAALFVSLTPKVSLFQARAAPS